MSKTVRELVSEARARVRLGDFREARRLYAEALRQEPEADEVAALRREREQLGVDPVARNVAITTLVLFALVWALAIG